MKNEEIFEVRFKKLRKQFGLSQMELAAELHVSKALIGMYESGKRMPSRETMEMIADYFNVTIDYLTGRETGSIYYIEPEYAIIAQKIKKRKRLKQLFVLAEKLSDDDLFPFIKIMERMLK